MSVLRQCEETHQQSKHKHDNCCCRGRGEHTQRSEQTSSVARLWRWVQLSSSERQHQECSFDSSAAGLPFLSGRGLWPFGPWWHFGYGCLDLTAGSCSCRTAAEEACGLPTCCAEKEREHAGDFTPARFGRKWLMAFDCFCASTKGSVNVSTTTPRRPEGFTERAIFSESFNSFRVSYKWRSSTTRFPILRPIARAVTFVALRARSVARRSS